MSGTIRKRHREQWRRDRKKRELAEFLGLPVRHGHTPIYDRYLHPEALIEFFARPHRKITAFERIENRIGEIKYLQPPVDPPTLGGYAMEAGVSKVTLWTWAQKYEEFEDAMNKAKDIQEDLFVRLALLGAFVPSVSIFALKNLHGWTDRTEVDNKGTVTLQFDKEDENA